ncbi:hypothetical protein EG329_011872 [Mollisiaceae sp. DMI_Dod_QoI]|nr:hypothetical protein EG329_011872 [Helotiales sp. DMI_Dod_QoI]
MSLPASKTTYAFTTENFTNDGMLFQKWHPISAINALTVSSEPPLTLGERRSFQLVASFEQGPPGFRMHLIGKWLTLVPQRMGLSAALDNSAALMATVHAAMLHDRSPSTWIGPEAYYQAIKSLRQALEDPIECYSVETLSATAILYYIEAIFGSPVEWNLVHHAGGVSRLLEARGPGKHKSGFEMLITRQMQGIAVNYETHSDTEASIQKLLELMVSWSDLSIEFRRYLKGQLSSPASNELRQRLAKTKSRLDSINMAIEEIFSSERDITQVKSSRNDPVLETVLDFKDYTFAVMLVLHDSYELIVNRMLSILDPRNITPQVECRNEWLVTRICRSYEYAWKRRPMGAQHMYVPLTVAFLQAKTEEMRTWILQALNDLDEHRMLPTPRFTASAITYLAQVYTGETDPIVPSNS